MRTELINLLKLHNYYHEVELRTHPDTCCNAEMVRVINFDRIKDDFCDVLQIGCKLKSVDAILFPNNKPNHIYFIEMSSFRARNLRTGQSYMDFIAEEMIGFKVPNKIIDSIFLLLAFIGYHNGDNAFYRYMLDKSKSKIITVFLLDLNDIEINELQLLSLDKQQIELTKRIEGEIVILNCPSFTAAFA